MKKYMKTCTFSYFHVNFKHESTEHNVFPVSAYFYPHYIMQNKVQSGAWEKKLTLDGINSFTHFPSTHKEYLSICVDDSGEGLVEPTAVAISVK